MLFNSRSFFLFFIAVTGVYFLIPHRWRWMLLLGASMFFYMAFVPKYIILLFLLAVVDYGGGILIAKAKLLVHKRAILIVCLCLDLGTLGFFKYFNFAADNLKALADVIHWNYGFETLAIVLPLGISFHIFQSLSYVIEVYRGNQKPEKHFGIFFLYIVFYPQLVAGPIERAGNLLHQFYEEHLFDVKRITDGILLMFWGLFKKVIIADRLAILVNAVFNDPTDISGLSLIAATFFFAIQIYCDFSGYSDIAIGAAEVMGFKLMQNFKRPYYATSIAEFWQRWHISLSSWLRDYLYIPLGGNRVTVGRQYLNIAVVFLASGLWHGANWTFIIWGALHAGYLIAGLITQKLRTGVVEFLRLTRIPRVHTTLQIGITFSLVSFGWIFFRARSLAEAFYIVGRAFAAIPDLLRPAAIAAAYRELNLNGFELALVMAAIGVMEIIHILQQSGSVRARLSRYPTWVQWSLAYGLIFTVYMLGIFDHVEFIYFQF